MWKQWIPMTLGVAFAALIVHRIWRTADSEQRLEMPAGNWLSGDAERQLYATPAGRYSQADIDANGPLPPSQRYRGFQARHDFRPLPGDRLCPITRTKANPECTWIIDGQTYWFCCPPCIDELVRTAKERPEALQPSAAYVQN